MKTTHFVALQTSKVWIVQETDSILYVHLIFSQYIMLLLCQIFSLQ